MDERGCGARNDLAQFNLAVMYANGRGVIKNMPWAVQLWEDLAVLGNPYAQYNLGVCYSRGIVVAVDKNLAMDWYRKSARMQYKPALKNLGILIAGDIIDTGDATLSVENWREAAYLVSGQCGKDNMPINTTILCELNHIHEMAESGNPFCQFDLAASYAANLNHTSAVEWYGRAAAQGHTDAMFELGDCYARGSGVQKDEFAAIELYREIVAKYTPYELNIYPEGIDDVSDIDQRYYVYMPTDWLQTAAEKGMPEAQFMLGLDLADKKNGIRDGVGAAHWYHLAAENGHPNAQANLGYCYKYGRGVGQDATTAVTWLSKAADQGDSVGQYQLALCYATGFGVGQSHMTAVEWFQRAADQGHIDSVIELAHCYDKGVGVEQNENLAQHWYCKAADIGNFNAKKMCEQRGWIKTDHEKTNCPWW